MPILHCADLALNYQTFGDATKPAIIFSNSLGTNYTMWQAQYQALQQDYFIVCYDTRGHGASSAPQGSYNLSQLGQDVIALLDHLQLKKVFFCGISMGGLTGQWLARHYPERFYHLMLCNTAAKIGQQQAWLERAALVREQGLAPIAATAASRWFTASFIEKNAQLVQDLSAHLAAGSAEGYASCCEALAHADLRAELSKIQPPITIVAGQYDPITTVEDGMVMQEKIPHAQLLKIAASHISNIEQATAFTQMLRESFIVA